MFRFVAITLALVLASCATAHKTIVPVVDPAGVPVAIEVKGVPPGETAKQSQISAISENLIDGIDATVVNRKYFPGFNAEADNFMLIVHGPNGTLTTKGGREFVGFAPYLEVGANRPAAEVVSAAKQIAADVYRKAKRQYTVYSQSELREAR